ncbi:Endopeptidase S2P [Psidium guajava]|nr:Endopeptidase S2P [Psidium guajava]
MGICSNSHSLCMIPFFEGGGDRKLTRPARKIPFQLRNRRITWEPAAMVRGESRFPATLGGAVVIVVSVAGSRATMHNNK